MHNDAERSPDVRGDVTLRSHVQPAHSSGLSTPLAPSTLPDWPWAGDAVRRFETRMLRPDRPFPCIFGVDAVKKASLRYTFVPVGPDRTRCLATALTEFTAIAPGLGSRTSLVAFFESDDIARDVEAWQELFWCVLDELQAEDHLPWPSGISGDPNAPDWEYGFAGVPFFVVANTPAHVRRASRYFEYFAITFQPRFVFDGLTAGTVGGDNARKIIRGRLARYDALPPAPDLGSFGQQGNREWTQYFLDDQGVATPAAAQCPISHRYARTSAAIQLDQQQPGTQSNVQNSDTEDLEMPDFSAHDLSISSDVLRPLLPDQGSIELQRDQPGKVHDWHWHSVDEELFLMEGDITLFWSEGGERRERLCSAGEVIRLSAGTLHGSVAGAGGGVYVIRAVDGVAAETVFLGPGDDPHITAPACPAGATGP